MGVCSLRRRKGDHIQMDNRKKTLRLAAYYFTQISRLLLAIFILLIVYAEKRLFIVFVLI